MTKGVEFMKCLKVDEGKGSFSLDGRAFSPLEKITKDDILQLLDIALDPDQEFEMDTYSAELLTDPAHKIIYKNLYEKFEELKANKEQFTDEINELYKDAYDKYAVTKDDANTSQEQKEAE